MRRSYGLRRHYGLRRRDALQVAARRGCVAAAWRPRRRLGQMAGVRCTAAPPSPVATAWAAGRRRPYGAQAKGGQMKTYRRRRRRPWDHRNPCSRHNSCSGTRALMTKIWVASVFIACPMPPSRTTTRHAATTQDCDLSARNLLRDTHAGHRSENEPSGLPDTLGGRGVDLLATDALSTHL